jgi:hypothetical protein
VATRFPNNGFVLVALFHIAQPLVGNSASMIQLTCSPAPSSNPKRGSAGEFFHFDTPIYAVREGRLCGSHWVPHYPHVSAARDRCQEARMEHAGLSVLPSHRHR